MTQDEIIEMARQVCDIAIDNRGRHTFVCDEYGLEAFAKLVAQHEREKIIAMESSSAFNRIRGEFSPTAKDLVQAIQARGQ